MTSRNGDRPERVLSATMELSLQCVQDSDRWFGDTMQWHTLRGLVHHALSLSGEAGEVANIVKKIDRGSFDIRDATVRHDLMMELTDVYVYLLNLAGLLGFDLEKTYEIVRGKNEARFIQQRKQREDAKIDNTRARRGTTSSNR